MKVYIRDSKLHGKGIFALRDIKKDEIVFIIKGKKVNFLINDKEKAEVAGVNWIGLNKNEWIDPRGFALYINHSCNPNAGIKGKVTVVALKNIKKNEEITIDYSLNESDLFWSMKCSCKENTCRKDIKSIKFLPKKVFNKYNLYIPKYFKKIFNKFNISNFKDKKHLEKEWVDFIKNKI